MSEPLGYGVVGYVAQKGVVRAEGRRSWELCDRRGAVRL